MSTYTIRYADRAAQAKAALSDTQRISLEALEKRLSLSPFAHGARNNRDNTWSAFFTGGMITYIVSNRHVVINIVNVMSI